MLIQPRTIQWSTVMDILPPHVRRQSNLGLKADDLSKNSVYKHICLILVDIYRALASPLCFWFFAMERAELCLRPAFLLRMVLDGRRSL